jgi:hypothetical protein
VVGDSGGKDGVGDSINGTSSLMRPPVGISRWKGGVRTRGLAGAGAGMGRGAMGGDTGGLRVKLGERGQATLPLGRPGTGGCISTTRLAKMREAFCRRLWWLLLDLRLRAGAAALSEEPAMPPSFFGMVSGPIRPG